MMKQRLLAFFVLGAGLLASHAGTPAAKAAENDTIQCKNLVATESIVLQGANGQRIELTIGNDGSPTIQAFTANANQPSISIKVLKDSSEIKVGNNGNVISLAAKSNGLANIRIDSKDTAGVRLSTGGKKAVDLAADRELGARALSIYSPNNNDVITMQTGREGESLFVMDGKQIRWDAGFDGTYPFIKLFDSHAKKIWGAP